MAIRATEYRDARGRRFARGLPDSVPDSQAVVGIPLGPPSLEKLGLPKDLEVRLHNQLYERGILTEQDARLRPNDIHAALMAALRVDVQRILAVYQGTDAVTPGVN